MSKKPARSRAGALFANQPWRCVHLVDHSEITACFVVGGRWETIANIRPAFGVTAKDIAEFLIKLVNSHRERGDLLEGAAETLEAILKDGLDFTTEQSAEHIVTHIKKVMP